jgi:hypothetical protein
MKQVYFFHYVRITFNAFFIYERQFNIIDTTEKFQ